MATSILSQIYKEASATSKGVVQMNRTLGKIYEDQEKSNKRQDKFLSDLQGRQKREEREEKKRQSDLKKLVAGISASKTKDKDDSKIDLGGGKGGIVGAVIGGITKSLGVFKLALGTLLTSKFAWMAALLPLLRPILRNTAGSGGGSNSGGNIPPEIAQQQQEFRDNPAQSIRETLTDTSIDGGDMLDNVRIVTPKAPRLPPSSALPKGNIFTRGLGAISKGFTKFIGKLLGPALLIWEMKDTVMDLVKKKQWKNLTRYLLKTVGSYAIGGTVGSVALSLAGLLGFATGGLAAAPALILSSIVATGASAYSEKVIDDILLKAGLFDPEDTSADDDSEVPEIPKVDVDASELEAANKDPNFKKKVEASDPLKRQRGGGIFDVPGHGQGDQVPMMLPPGAFVLNRVAAQEMFARGGSPSGMVPTLLEPGEKVFMPGDPLMDMAMSFNSSFSRFQKGGPVGGDSRSPSSSDASRLGSSGIMFKENANIKPGGHMTFIGDGSGFTGEIKLIDGSGQVVSRIGGVSGVAGTAGTSQEERKNPGRPRSNYPIPDGTYPLERKTTRHPGQNVGEWSSWINNPSGQIANRGQIFLHNDIGSNGTAGCIGIEAGGSRGSINSMKFADMYDKVQPQHVKVNLSASEGNTYSPGGAADGSGGESGGGALGSITSAIGNTFGGIFGSDGPVNKVFSSLTDKMSGMMSEVTSRLQSPEAKALTGKLQQGMSDVMSQLNGELSSGGQLQASSPPSSDHMRVIRDAMDPEANQEQTIVQVIPGEQQPEPTISGQVNQNLPPGLSTRCPSWASADYRYDRSLNCETL